MDLHAVKVQSSAWSVTWELRIRNQNKVVGEMIHNTHGKIYTAIVRSRHTGLVRESYTNCDRQNVLNWAREQIVNEPELSLDGIDAEIARCCDWRYRDEMSDDFAYINGKIDRWDRIIKDLKRLREQIALKM